MGRGTLGEQNGGPMARPTIKERKLALRQQGCVNCGQPYGRTDPYRRIELDHITAWGKAPEIEVDNFDNLQPLCGRCNRYKNQYTYEELNLRLIVNWPNGFDWDRLAWVTWNYLPEDRERLNAMTWDELDEFSETDEYEAMQMRRVPEYTPAVWIHGELFDVPLWPYQAAETDVPTHPAPQYLSEPTGREK